MAQAARSHSVLFMGSSSVVYGESGTGSTMHSLTQQLLREQTHSDDWVCLSELLFYGPAMADRAQKMVKRHRPAVVVVYLQKSQFTTEKVVYRIRERWPRFYDRAYAMADWWKKVVAGGGSYGAPGLRGWLFRVPLFVAERLIGTAPEIRVEDAIACTADTIERLAALEELTIVVKMPKETSGTPKTAEQLARGQRFRAAIGDLCGSRHVAYYLSEDSRPTARRRWLSKKAVDGLHATRERVEEQAAHVVTQILEAVRETASAPR